MALFSVTAEKHLPSFSGTTCSSSCSGHEHPRRWLQPFGLSKNKERLLRVDCVLGVLQGDSPGARLLSDELLPWMVLNMRAAS